MMGDGRPPSPPPCLVLYIDCNQPSLYRYIWFEKIVDMVPIPSIILVALTILKKFLLS